MDANNTKGKTMNSQATRGTQRARCRRYGSEAQALLGHSAASTTDGYIRQPLRGWGDEQKRLARAGEIKFILRQCPCCGAPAEFRTVSEGENAGGKYAECTKCGLSTKLFFPIHESVDALITAHWNARA